MARPSATYAPFGCTQGFKVRWSSASMMSRAVRSVLAAAQRGRRQSVCQFDRTGDPDSDRRAWLSRLRCLIGKIGWRSMQTARSPSTLNIGAEQGSLAPLPLKLIVCLVPRKIKIFPPSISSPRRSASSTRPSATLSSPLTVSPAAASSNTLCVGLAPAQGRTNTIRQAANNKIAASGHTEYSLPRQARWLASPASGEGHL